MKKTPKGIYEDEEEMKVIKKEDGGILMMKNMEMRNWFRDVLIKIDLMFFCSWRGRREEGQNEQED